MIKKLKFKPGDIEKLYEEQAVKYSKFAGISFSWRYLEKPLMDKILKNCNAKGLRVLDAGCGDGRLLKYLMQKGIPGENIVGVDISSEMLALAKKYVPQVKTYKSGLSDFRSKNKFDLIVCSHVLHYVDEKGYQKSLNNFYKLLKIGGSLVVVLTHPVRTTRSDLTQYFRRDWIVDHTPWGTSSPFFVRPVGDIVNGIIKAGFTIRLLEEPSVPASAKRSDPTNYLKYSCCPSRVAVVAVKLGEIYEKVRTEFHSC